MADANPEAFFISIVGSEKWKANGPQLYQEYPKCTFPLTLKASTGKKAKSCLFEEIISHLYEKSAKMVAFKTNVERLPAWIRSAWLYYYDYLGEMDTYNINWTHDPPHWSKDGATQLKSINIHVSVAGEAEAEFDNPLLYHLTIFVTTGLIEVQGNQYEQFQTEVFPVLHKCVTKMLEDKQFQTATCTDQSVHWDSQDDNDTFINLSDPVDQPLQSHSCDSPVNSMNKSFDKTLIDSLMEDQVDKISDHIAPVNDTAGTGADDSLTVLKESWANDHVHPDPFAGAIQTDNLTDITSSTETNACTPAFLHQFEDNMSEAIIKLKNSQEQLISNQVVAVIKSQSEVLEKHGKLLNSICSKMDNIQKSSTPQKSGQEASIKKLENEVSRLKQRIHILESEKSEHEYKIQKLRSEYEMKISITESENEFLQQKVDRMKQQVSSTMTDTSQEENLLLDKLNKKNQEILQLESTNITLHKKLSEAEFHVSNSSVNDDLFQTVSHKPNSVDKVKEVITPKQPTNVNAPIVIDKENEVLLVGTSIIRNIEPKYLSKDYDIKKSSAYTLDETAQLIKDSKSDPSAVIFHSMTNDLKTEDPATCVNSLHDIVDTTLQKWPSTQVMISMETPRADDSDINNKVLVANGLIRSTFYKQANVSIIDNTNLAVQGQPISRFLNASDKIHLSRQGTSMLAANIQSALDAHFGVKSNSDKSPKSPPPGGRGGQPPGGRGRRRAGTAGGYFMPWFRHPDPSNGYFGPF